MHKLVGLQLFLSGTPTFSSGTPTFCQMGVLNSCFQNPSESSDHVSVPRCEVWDVGWQEKVRHLLAAGSSDNHLPVAFGPRIK